MTKPFVPGAWNKQLLEFHHKDLCCSIEIWLVFRPAVSVGRDARQKRQLLSVRSQRQRAAIGHFLANKKRLGFLRIPEPHVACVGHSAARANDVTLGMKQSVMQEPLGFVTILQFFTDLAVSQSSRIPKGGPTAKPPLGSFMPQASSVFPSASNFKRRIPPQSCRRSSLDKLGVSNVRRIFFLLIIPTTDRAAQIAANQNRLRRMKCQGE